MFSMKKENKMYRVRLIEISRVLVLCSVHKRLLNVNAIFQNEFLLARIKVYAL